MSNEKEAMKKKHEADGDYYSTRGGVATKQRSANSVRCSPGKEKESLGHHHQHSKGREYDHQQNPYMMPPAPRNELDRYQDIQEVPKFYPHQEGTLEY